MEYVTEDFSNYFDWNLPVAISAGVDPEQLVSLTDDEIRALHQPYVDIANLISTELGVDISIGTIDCYFMSRDDILYTISNITLAEIDFRLRELGEGIRRAEYANRVFDIVQEFGYGLQALIDAFDCEDFDPIEAYYRIQQGGINSFIESIEYISR